MRGLKLADTAFLAKSASGGPVLPVTAGLVLHLKADAITGIADGGTITTWSDVSGLNNHFQQTGAASIKPIYRLNQQNGRPGVDFDGTDDYFIGTTTVSGSSVYSMFLALTLDAVPATAGIFRNGDFAGWGFTLGGGQREILHRGVAACDDGAGTTSPEIWSAVRTAAPLAKLWVNGVNQAITNSTSGVNPAVSVGWIGVFSAALGLYMNGRIFEIVVYDTPLSDADRGLVEAYLSSKWAI